MKWLPIDRDENGFATEECLRMIEGLINAKAFNKEYLKQ